jgi:hypothetical protein
MNFENFNFEGVDVEQVFTVVQQVLEGGFHSPEAQELRAQLRASCPALTAEQASLLLPWVEALASHLRQVGAPASAPAQAPKVPVPFFSALPPRPAMQKIPFFA